MGAGPGEDQRGQYYEEAVGANHPTKEDVLNRHALVEHHNDGTHNYPDSGTKMLFNQSSAPTGWTIDNTGLTDASGNGRMIVAVHSNQYGSDDGSQDPTNMTTPSQDLDSLTPTNWGLANEPIFAIGGTGELQRLTSGASSYATAKDTVNTVTLTPYYRHIIIAEKD